MKESLGKSPSVLDFRHFHPMWFIIVLLLRFASKGRLGLWITFRFNRPFGLRLFYIQETVMRFRPVFALGLAALLSASNVNADCGCGSAATVATSACCGSVGGVIASAGASACGSQVTYVEKTVMVPTQVVEKRMVTKTTYKTEEKQEEYTIVKMVPRTVVREEKYTEVRMVPRTEKKVSEVTVLVSMRERFFVTIRFSTTCVGTITVFST